MTLMVYGIKNCNSMKKTFQWLVANGIDFTFVDFKTTAPTESEIKIWLEGVGDSLVNTRGSSYRQLRDEIKAKFTGQMLVDTILNKPTLIKRPLLVNGDVMIVGFVPNAWIQTANLLTK